MATVAQIREWLAPLPGDAEIIVWSSAGTEHSIATVGHFSHDREKGWRRAILFTGPARPRRVPAT